MDIREERHSFKKKLTLKISLLSASMKLNMNSASMLKLTTTFTEVKSRMMLLVARKVSIARTLTRQMINAWVLSKEIPVTS